MDVLEESTSLTLTGRKHDSLCLDRLGHPHDNECECWCHDERDYLTKSLTCSKVSFMKKMMH